MTHASARAPLHALHAPDPVLPPRPAAGLPSPGDAASRDWPQPLRHRALALSFVLLVALPAAAATLYLFLGAAGQYHSDVAFSVRSEQTPSVAAGLLGAITQIGPGTASDADILFDYIRSARMVAAVDARLDLRAVFSRARGADPVFALPAGASDEDLLRYWGRMVHVRLDHQAGILSVRAEAFTAADARAVTEAILAESTRLVNALSDQARQDAIRFAAADLAEAQAALRDLRGQLSAFRREYRMADPTADLAGQMGLLGALQSDLAAALVDRDTLRGYADDKDQRMTRINRRIDAISARIEAERTSLGLGEGGPEMAEVLGRYEALLTDIEFAQAAYTQALSNLAVARAEARRQARYLAAHIPPTLATSAEYPRRGMLSGLIALFLLLGWSALAVVFYNLRDSRQVAGR